MHGAELDDRTLRRIIATLLALAALAESVAGRSLPVRWLVFAILRVAEAVARDFLVETLQTDCPSFEDDPVSENGPADAASLGLRFRLLAAILAALLPAAERTELSVNRARLRFPPLVFVAAPRFVRLLPNDTS